MIALTAEMRAAACRRMGVDELDAWTAAALVDVLALVERDLPRCPFIEWGFKVRLCSLPIGHDGAHDLKDRVLS